MTPALKNLLDAIGSKEAPKGYGQIYGGAKGVGFPDVSKMTLKDVRALQDRMVKNGSASSACGRYQFIRKTLAATILEMGLKDSDVWTPDLQDRMAVHLMEKRKLGAYMAGTISRETFANNLAMEWASLPVVTAIRGAHRQLAPGQSYYAGDGLNKAHHAPAAILALVDALKTDTHPPPDIEPVVPATPSYKPSIQMVMSVLLGLAAAIAAYFMKG